MKNHHKRLNVLVLLVLLEGLYSISNVTSPFLKDFASTIPGHGGIMDRFDCQYLMATFTHVYIASFIRWVEASRRLRVFLNRAVGGAQMFNRCLAGARTRASCCNSCWCFSLNSSSASSTRCSITWERGTYCPLLPSDRCRRRGGEGGGGCVWRRCGSWTWACTNTQAHTHFREGSVCERGPPAEIPSSSSWMFTRLQPIMRPWPWRDDMEQLQPQNTS